MTHDSSLQHRYTLDLLSRYAELMLAGRDAESMYPDVAQHLRQCTSCRGQLEDLLEANMDDVDDELSDDYRLALRGFLNRLDEEALVSVRPGSRVNGFRACIQMREIPSSELGMRSEDRAPENIQRGRLLFADHVMIGDKKFGVKLDLADPQPGQDAACKVTGLIYPIDGDLPAEIHAQLDSGRDIYDAIVGPDGALCFENVVLHDDTRLTLTLESPE